MSEELERALAELRALPKAQRSAPALLANATFLDAVRLISASDDEQLMRLVRGDKLTAQVALEALARAYFGSAQLTRAEDALVRLVHLAPANGWARRALARTLERQSRHDEAVPHHRMADALGVQ